MPVMMNPPLRSEGDRRAIIEGLVDGIIDMIASDHAPHRVDEKEVEFDRAAFGIVGLETSLALSSTNIILPESLTISMHKKRRWIEGIKGQRFDLEDVEQGVDLDEILATIENAYLKKAMELSGGNKSTAADYLKLSLRSMRYRLDKNP